MPDIEVLRDLTPQFPPPGLDDLAAVVRRRRRRAVLAAGAGVATAAVLTAAVVTGIPGNDRSMDPVDEPTDGRTGQDLSWAPEQIRAEGDTHGILPGRDGALDARFWSVCERANCDYGTTGDNYDHRVVHSALEVTVDGYRTSGLFGLNGGPGEVPETHLQPFDDDTIFVQDMSRHGGTQERYRLLNADGTTTELTMLPSTAPAAAGPDVVRFSSRSEDLARVDEAAGTIQRLDLPPQVHAWAQSATDKLLWGVANGCVLYLQLPGGGFGYRELPCRSRFPDLWIDDGSRTAAWFTAERIAVTELGGSKSLPVALHVSLDRGDTWQRIPVTEDTMDEVLAQQR